ncbi:unnamed protein product [Parnassius apollo]|uniref:(apollo) hypothetical protein n=1 Tax=Parnassius apollo TaxID=110799 RepID=A0A8S3W9W2_PARAO|nr:unnamed protein product [Parnassius apollo]
MLILATVCDPNNQACMYGTCQQCQSLYLMHESIKDKETIQWKEWGRLEEHYEKDGKKVKVYKNVQQDKEGTVQELMKIFNEELKVLKTHIYNMKTEDIEIVTKQLPPKISPLMGTLKVHQIFSDVREEIKYRTLSCFCTRGFCECLQPKVYLPISNASVASSDNTTALLAEEDICETEKESDGVTNVNAELPSSSDDEVPLSDIIKRKTVSTPLSEIQLIDLCKPGRKNKCYNFVYNTPEELSEDEQQDKQDEQVPSTSSGKENQPVRCGDFLIVNVHATKGKLYKYACVVDDLDDDGEIRVTFMRSVKQKKVFILNNSDRADVDYTDIVQILPKPTTFEKRGQFYYEFEKCIEVHEK